TGTSFVSSVELTPGANDVVARCTAPDGTPERSAPLVWDERLRPGPTATIRVRTRGRTVILDGSHSRAAEPDGARVVRFAWHEDARHPSPLTSASGLRLRKPVGGPRLELRAPPRDGEYYVSLTVTDARGGKDT